MGGTFCKSFSLLALTVTVVWPDKRLGQLLSPADRSSNMWQSTACRNLSTATKCILEAWKFSYVALWDPESTKFQWYLGPSPRNWRTLIHFNVVSTISHIDHTSQGVCKNVRNTFQCVIVLQLRGEDPENLSQICPIVMCLFRTFSPRLENNGASKCSSDSFAHTLRYVVNVKTVRTTLKCINILQWKGEGLK